MDKTKCQIIEDCPDFMYGCCQKYLDGDCSAYKCDLKIIRELQQKLQAKEQECERLEEKIKSQKEEIKNLNYTLFEDRELTTDLVKANLKISKLEREMSSIRNRFKHENKIRNEQLDQLKQALDEVEKFMIYEFSGQNQWVKKNVLDIINKAKGE